MTQEQRHTVLVIEDEEDLREMLREALELNGYLVATACEGGEALAKIEAIDHLCLILLDLLMPGMNGWDFCDALRERSEFDSVPVIVHSSTTRPAPKGATRVLQKPLMFEQLISVAREFCAG